MGIAREPSKLKRKKVGLALGGWCRPRAGSYRRVICPGKRRHIGTYSLIKSSLEEAAVVIEPKVAHIGAAKFHHASELVLQGELATQQAIPEIRRKLGSR